MPSVFNRRPRLALKTPAQIERMRAAGAVVGAALERMTEAVAPGVSTRDLDELAAQVIREAGAKPSFLGYHGYPATICASVNDEIVHGIPGHRVLHEGDLVSLDCGAIVDGWHGDAAVTVAVGDVTAAERALIAVTQESLRRGIAAFADGAHLSDIGHAIESYVRAEGPYGLVEEYTGHGIGTEMHQDPHVPNYGEPGHGPILRPGVVLAIEPMVTIGSAETRELDDGWTVVTADGSKAAHFEHTIALTDAGPEILTVRRR